MRLGATRLALVLTLGLAGAAWWDGSQRRPLGPAAGTSLAGLPRGVAAGDRELTVLQYNIHRGAPAEGPENLAATAACLRDAELAGLNEVDGADWLDGEPDQAQALGERLGLAWLYVPSERRWWHAHFGNGLLSALPAESWHRVPLPQRESRSFRSRLETTLDWHGIDPTLVARPATASWRSWPRAAPRCRRPRSCWATSTPGRTIRSSPPGGPIRPWW